ncbi:glycosyltransferase family 39 protein [Candidatus Collierbacteria bacterium]|nr:glycosyltransferase family 39 protein [Candidatus Collierbacteria bacterium]
MVSLNSWFHFEFDEEVIVWKLREFVSTGKPFLIGGGTPFGFHLGPAFYYLSSIPLWFSHLDPIGWGITAAIFGTGTIWLMWLVGKTLFSERIGLIAALLWATSFMAVMSDRHWWPLVLDPILSLLVILCLIHILKNGKFRKLPIWWWIILGSVLALAWQADLTVLPLFMAVGVAAVLNFRRQWKGILAAVGILAISLLPLVFFEFRHPGANLGKFMQGVNPPVGVPDINTLLFIPQGLSRLLFPITNLNGNLLKFYSWCREIADGRVNNQPWWAIGLTIFLLSIPFFSGKFRKLPTPENSILRILILSGIVGIFIFRSRGGNLYDFYLAVLYPVVILLAAGGINFIWEKWGKIVAVAGLMVIVGFNLFIISKSYHPQGLAVKRQAVVWAISNVGNEEFDLDSISSCSRYNGVRYLFLLSGKEPQSSFVDQDLSWLYDKKAGYMKPRYLVTFITPDDLTPEQNKKYNQLKMDDIESKVFSPSLEVIISKYE